MSHVHCCDEVDPDQVCPDPSAHERSAGAAPLDVERLAAAMAVNGISDGDGLPLFDIAERITAEYARLSEGTDR